MSSSLESPSAARVAAAEPGVVDRSPLPLRRKVRAYVELTKPRVIEHTVTASSPGARVSLEHYGESADGARLMEKYGFTGEHVAEVTRGLL